MITDTKIYELYKQLFEQAEGCQRVAPHALPPLVYIFARTMLALGLEEAAGIFDKWPNYAGRECAFTMRERIAK